MQSWPEIFARFSDLKVLIIGDVMVDAYIWGSVERISPEAPVPIINVRKRDFRLGGAANVALNVLSLGAKPILCAIAGHDVQGNRLLHLLEDKGMSKEGIVISETRPTTVKARVIAAHQHIIRIDDEQDAEASDEEENALLRKIESLMPECQVVIFEDYDKGVITPKIIEESVRLAKKLNIPTIVDPKKRNFLHYKNVTLFKPNLKELREGLKLEIEAGDQNLVNKAVETVKQKLGVEGVMLTLSERGVYIDYHNQKTSLPAHKREISDVSGAGDTVVSIAALCVALDLSAEKIAFLANLGGGLVCQYVGVVPVNREELLSEAKELELV
ncbi:MAG TPA: bifunctional ADP-heptose synthase [Cyclobacteriaceae bacterium]|nr:bifunctional ADP-heptose synthase [Cyclobacteriaceae bacterium]